MINPVVYLDVDGVLADFEGKAFELFGNQWKPEIDKPEWGRFQEYPNLYAILEPFPDAKRLYEGCVKLTRNENNVKCLTALPNRARHHFPDAAKDKIEWINKHISKDLRVYFGPFAIDKQHHAKTKQDVLIDDMQINIDQWNNIGSHGILHRSVDESLEKLEEHFYKNRGKYISYR